MVGVKIRGLPFKATLDHINAFFANHEAVEGSFMFGYNKEGRKDGFGTLLFEDETVVGQVVQDLNREYIGDRYVEIYPIAYSEYQNFHRGGGFKTSDHCNLSDICTDENKSLCLVATNLPFHAKRYQYVEFFSDIC